MPLSPEAQRSVSQCHKQLEKSTYILWSKHDTRISFGLAWPQLKQVFDPAITHDSHTASWFLALREITFYALFSFCLMFSTVTFKHMQKQLKLRTIQEQLELCKMIGSVPFKQCTLEVGLHIVSCAFERRNKVHVNPKPTEVLLRWLTKFVRSNRCG